ncbi:MAG: polysaccharide deacetylase family protein [Candidatus Polarisedimenticolaceae bacterium]|nr:polysaccharide deacetylase family protein [Candidatus Polarisedimenticolaceae bacterium]
MAATPSSAVVFIYHRFGEAEFPSTNTTLEQFDAHLDYLEREQFTIWPLARIVDAIIDNTPMPDRTVAITIDDANLSIYREAYPRLKRRGWPFSVFVSTELIDNGYPSFMTWPQMREMQQFGASFYNHSSSHDPLNRQRPNEEESDWLNRVRADIEQAEERLTAELGHHKKLFAYPYGEYNEPLANVVQQLGYVAFGQQSGALSHYSDLRLLPRYPMANIYANIDDFALKTNTLAMPVIEVSPWEPEVSEEPPRMEIKLAESDANLNRLACYTSNQTSLPIEWIDRTKGHFSVQAETALPIGRSRYNCTAPSAEKGRFYWFSHLWIRSAQ